MAKGLCIAVVVLFAGFVGYKIVQKKNPDMIKKVKGSIDEAGKKVSDILMEARASFREGYAQG